MFSNHASCRQLGLQHLWRAFCDEFCGSGDTGPGRGNVNHHVGAVTCKGGNWHFEVDIMGMVAGKCRCAREVLLPVDQSNLQHEAE